MSGIKMSVGAELDQAALQQEMKKLTDQFNRMQQEIARVNKTKYQPVDKSSLEDLRKITREFETLKRISGDLRRKMKQTGQEGAGFGDLDYTRMYPNPATRARVMAQHLQYVTGGGAGGGGGFAPPSPGGGFGGGWGGIPGQVAGAAFRGAGPVGGVIANSASAGMAGGIGAGLAGLVGGMLALGAGKIVGELINRIGQAEDNAVMVDRLKRSLGDVNVSYGGLKGSIYSRASSLGVTLDDATRLASQYAKQGNIGTRGARSLMAEAGAGIGLSKSFGLDPSEGVSVLGAVRGMGITRNETETKKFALLIGETIGKSNAFAKAGEVFDAISGFAVNQTRNSLSPANMAGYTGMFSALVGSGIPGLDPTGASNLLGRVNASLMAGGARGEASQFFSSMVGQSMGLDPIQTQIMREGGAFSTNDNSFGAGSVASRYGISGPAGSKTFMQASLDMLRNKYGHNKGLLAKATAEHFGVSMRQAMAILSTPSNAMGEMAGYAGDITSLNERGIATLSKVVTGTDEDRRGVFGELMSRTGPEALSDKERSDLQATMETGTVEQQKQMLAKLVASRDQEQTDGKNIEQSKIALENMKTLMADKLIPFTQDIRDGILYMVGGKGKSRADILGEIAGNESDARIKRIEGDAAASKGAIHKEFDDAEQSALLDQSNDFGDMRGWKEFQEKMKNGTATPEEISEFSGRVRKRLEVMPNDPKSIALEGKLKGLALERKRRLEDVDRRRTDALEREKVRRADSLKQIDRNERMRSAPTSDDSLSSFDTPEERNRVGAYLDSIGQAEGATYNTLYGGGTFSDYSKHPNIAFKGPDGITTAAGKYQIVKSTWDDVARALGLTDFSPASQDKAAIWLMKRRGALEHVKRGEFDIATSKLGQEWQGLPSGASPNQGKRSASEFKGMLEYNLKKRDERVPDGQVNTGQQRFILDAAPIEIFHRNERGEQVRPSQRVEVAIRPASPFGTEKIA